MKYQSWTQEGGEPPKFQAIQTVDYSCPHCYRLVKVVVPPDKTHWHERAEFLERQLEKMFYENTLLRNRLKEITGTI